jgi:DNA-binding transcriptional ArsR family regulator
MRDVAVISDPAAAEAALHRIRSRLLAELSDPDSASSVGARLGLPRQQVNYHLKELERLGLVELVEERRKGNCNERIVQATARSYVISPAALAAVAPDTTRSPDHLSSQWLLALAGRLVRDVGELIEDAASAQQRLATMAIDGEIRFATAADRTAFTEELNAVVASLVGRYHDESAPRGRNHRIVVAVHPSANATAKEH